MTLKNLRRCTERHYAYKASIEAYVIRQCQLEQDHRKRGKHRHSFRTTLGPYPSALSARSALDLTTPLEGWPGGIPVAVPGAAAARAERESEERMKLINLEPNVDNLLKYFRTVHSENAPLAHALVQAGWDLKSFAIREKLLIGELTLMEALATKSEK